MSNTMSRSARNGNGLEIDREEEGRPNGSVLNIISSVLNSGRNALNRIPEGIRSLPWEYVTGRQPLPENDIQRKVYLMTSAAQQELVEFLLEKDGEGKIKVDVNGNYSINTKNEDFIYAGLGAMLRPGTKRDVLAKAFGTGAAFGVATQIMEIAIEGDAAAVEEESPYRMAVGGMVLAGAVLSPVIMRQLQKYREPTINQKFQDLVHDVVHGYLTDEVRDFLTNMYISQAAENSKVPTVLEAGAITSPISGAIGLLSKTSFSVSATYSTAVMALVGAYHTFLGDSKKAQEEAGNYLDSIATKETADYPKRRRPGFVGSLFGIGSDDTQQKQGESSLQERITNILQQEDAIEEGTGNRKTFQERLGIRRHDDEQHNPVHDGSRGLV